MYHIILDGKYRTNSCTDYRTHSDREFANLKILPPFSQEHIYIYIYYAFRPWSQIKSGRNRHYLSLLIGVVCVDTVWIG